MAGMLPFSGLQIGVETVAGTAVATTRELYPDLPGSFDPGIIRSLHEGAQRGTSSNITHATIIGHRPSLTYRSDPTHGITWDELVILGSQIDGGNTGTGAGADKVWTFAPTQTGPTWDTYTLNIFDVSQCFEVDYGFMTGWSISGGFDDLTQCTMDWVARQTAKVTVDTVAANNAVKIPSNLWTMKYASAQSGLTGASALANTLRSWTLSVDTPQRARWYAGSLGEFGQALGSNNLGGTLQMTWDSTADAVAQYDLYAAGTPAFFRLAATGPTLGGTTYLAQIDVCVLWEDSFQPIATESDGVLEYSMIGRIAYDATWTQSLTLGCTCSIAALP